MAEKDHAIDVLKKDKAALEKEVDTLKKKLQLESEAKLKHETELKALKVFNH